MWMWHSGTQLSGGLGNAGLDNLRGLFQPKQFPSSKFLPWAAPWANEALLELLEAERVSQPALGTGCWRADRAQNREILQQLMH